MPVGAIMPAIRQYMGPMCVLEAQQDHIILNTTVVLINSLLQADQADHGLHLTELAANIAA